MCAFIRSMLRVDICG